MIKIFIVILITALLSGCAYLPQTANQPRPTPDSSEPGQVVLPEAEEVPDVVVSEKKDPPEPIEYQSLADHYLPEESENPSGQTRGFRVQLLTTKSSASADSFVVHANKNLDMPIYIVYEPPYYKIRAGNFKNHEEAVEAKPKIESRGFETFIVRDIIECGEDN
jgi:hypothetical protein